ncbi:MAG TPA: CHAD domain-containing protein, partial [Longimicrobiaceae bacterium]|nr:CHAD domain-containing protein [Longimicrobiaceae bacterium]
PRLASVLARLALELAGELERRLAEVRSLGDQDPAHRARIAAKRLRYLLEPVQDELDGAPGIIRQLKSLQDALGAMHDADVLLARLAAEPPGDAGEPATDDGQAAPADAFPALRRMLEDERAARFGEVEAGWLQGHAAGFFAAAREVAHAAAGYGELEREIERKYLLKRMPAIGRLEGVDVLEVHQGYVPGEELIERLRRTRRGDEVKYFRTMKMGRGISRIEVEEETSESVFRRMWPLTRGRRVRKRRYVVRDGGFTWEIDRFRDRRLVLCEVELPSEDTHAEPPRWLQREIVRDVTDESEYTNLNLAK